MSREVMQMALDALVAVTSEDFHDGRPIAAARDALRSALAQPAPEPVGYVYSSKGIKRGAIDDQSLSPGDVLYTVQPAAQPAPAVPDGWVMVSDRMPASGVVVLACYTNSMGNVRRIRAQWVAAKTSESGPCSDIGEYDEEADTYYDPVGWYECIDNWDEYTSITVHQGDVTHWMPLPAAPGSAPAAPAAPAAPVVRKPLTDAEIEKLRENTFSVNNPFCPVDSKSMRKAVRAAERAHGITGDSNG